MYDITYKQCDGSFKTNASPLLESSLIHKWALKQAINVANTCMSQKYPMNTCTCTDCTHKY